MQHNNGFSIVGAFLSGFGSIVVYFEQNTGFILAIVGVLSWVSGVYFQRRKDRRDHERHEMERAEHRHRIKLLELGQYVERGNNDGDGEG
ncbi:MAG: hypothetical protein PHE17_19515 [Thiothrix sp.]|uniref:hypothetical protein n=1 Tax=Thiothrix sp. TaxID=1032 RepID=UPI0026088BAC|nr:hypothetical protein [Thiothrix sp.]MDD5395217.1 hypothetical protein [Thiothrix sp.]